MRVRSIQRVGSKSSSVSILKVVSRVMATAAASWSNPQISCCESSPVVHLRCHEDSSEPSRHVSAALPALADNPVLWGQVAQGCILVKAPDQLLRVVPVVHLQQAQACHFKALPALRRLLVLRLLSAHLESAQWFCGRGSGRQREVSGVAQKMLGVP